MIEDVKEVGSQLHFDLLTQPRVLHDGKIEVPEIRSDEGIATQVAKVVARIRGVTKFGVRIPVARRCKGAEIQDRERCARSGEWIPDHIRPFEKFVAVVEALERI